MFPGFFFSELQAHVGSPSRVYLDSARKRSHDNVKWFVLTARPQLLRDRREFSRNCTRNSRHTWAACLAFTYEGRRENDTPLF